MDDRVKEAIIKVKNTERNFVQSVELTVNLKDLDFKQPESRVRGEISLPKGKGKPTRIGVFAEGDMAQQAKKQGLDVYAKEDIKEMGENKKKAKLMAESHDFFIAQADLMPAIGRSLGPVLGRRNKMPTPVPPVAPLEPILEKMQQTINIDSKNKSVIHCVIGTEEMADDDLAENALAVISVIERNLPAGENNISSIHMKTTMGKSIRVM
jgi:large subunit ribosomal protein L1